jgi:serine/threonine-protein kinase
MKQGEVRGGDEAMRRVGRLSPEELPEGTRVGPWCVVERLGVGGYGAVYRVRDTRPVEEGGHGGEYALKLALSMGEVARRLEREAELLERVAHPGVVKRVEVGHWLEGPQRLPYLVMEQVRGPALYEWAQGCNPLLSQAVEMMGGMAEALEVGHAAGAWHRDVKGANVRVRGEDGRAVLMDFGAGDYAGAERLTRGLLPPGTWLYRSPEALRFEREHRANPRARYGYGVGDEVYALGVTWYRVLADGYPFDELEWEEALRARERGEVPPSPCTFNPCLPRELGELVVWMLAPRAEERPADMGEVKRALEAVKVEPGAHLFAWEEELTAGSRTTEATGVWGPVAPGDELALEREREGRKLRLMVARLGPMRCRRPRPKPPPPAQEARPAVREPAAKGKRPARWYVGWGLAVAVGVLLVLLAGLLLRADWGAGRSEAVVSSAPAAMEAVESKEEIVVTVRKIGSEEAERLAREEARRLWERCLSAASVGVVLAACAGVPAQPERPVCTDEARATMKKMGLQPGDQGDITVDFNQPGYSSDMGIYQEGPIVSEVLRVYTEGYLPAGTRLHGRMWTQGEKVYAHYAWAKRPDGEEFPVCIILGGTEFRSWRKDEDSPPQGPWKMQRVTPFTVVERFE